MHLALLGTAVVSCPTRQPTGNLAEKRVDTDNQNSTRTAGIMIMLMM